MPRFTPKPNDILCLPFLRPGANRKEMTGYRVEEGALKGKPYVSTGGKARIFRLSRDCDQTRWALKVFLNSEHRTEEILKSSSRLSDLASMPGLKAALRCVITPDQEIARQNPDLMYAIIMPWISGQTYYDVFGSYSSQSALPANSRPLPESISHVLARSRNFIEIMGWLEWKGYTHTDVSSDNLIAAVSGASAPHQSTPNKLDTQLIDLEDVWNKGIAGKNNFKKGYGHPSLQKGATSACPEGDRYATIILTAEILLISAKHLAPKFEADGYFRGNREEARHDAQISARYEDAQKYLGKICPPFADVLAQAWKSSSLTECARIADLLPALVEKRGSSQPEPDKHPVFDATEGAGAQAAPNPNGGLYGTKKEEEAKPKLSAAEAVRRLRQNRARLQKTSSRHALNLRDSVMGLKRILALANLTRNQKAVITLVVCLMGFLLLNLLARK